MRITNIFWTGGFDSTYRVCELLARGKETVRPIYVIDRDRRSLARELSAIAVLREMVISRFGCESSLLPLEVYLKEDFPPSDEVCAAFAAIKDRVHIGTQYGWLAQFSITMAWKYGKIELCTQRHNPPAGWQVEVFENPHSKNTGLKGGYARHLFQHFLFQTLHLTKNDMKMNSVKKGFYDILMNTWFCHWPVGSLPCGVCNPCRIARTERENIRFAFLGRERRFISVLCGRLKKL